MKTYNMKQHLENGLPNTEWIQARAGLFTGSDFHQYFGILNKGLTDTAKKELYKKVLEKFGYTFSTPTTYAMQWGIDHEAEAREAYKFLYNKDVQEVGFCDYESLNAGCSPDGVIYDGENIKEIVEIKCPMLETYVAYIDGFMKPEYMTQCQYNMFITGADVCHFIVYHPDMQLFVKDIEKDEAIQTKIKNTLDALQPIYNDLYEKIKTLKVETC